MIDAVKISQEIADLRIKLGDEDIKTAQVNRIKKRILFLKHVAIYLESSPTEAFIRSESDRIQKRINLISADYPRWITSKFFIKEKEKLKEYLKENEVPKLKMQLSALFFIQNA